MDDSYEKVFIHFICPQCALQFSEQVGRLNRECGAICPGCDFLMMVNSQTKETVRLIRDRADEPHGELTSIGEQFAHARVKRTEGLQVAGDDEVSNTTR